MRCDSQRKLTPEVCWPTASLSGPQSSGHELQSLGARQFQKWGTGILQEEIRRAGDSGEWEYPLGYHGSVSLIKRNEVLYKIYLFWGAIKMILQDELGKSEVAVRSPHSLNDGSFSKDLWYAGCATPLWKLVFSPQATNKQLPISKG